MSGAHGKVINKKKPLRAKGNKVRRKRRQEVKILKGDKSVIVENIELLSKGQLKKLAKNPTNSIRASGKKRLKVLQRIKHSQKEKNKMEDREFIEHFAVDEAGSSSLKKQTETKSKLTTDKMGTDIVVDNVDALLDDNCDEEMIK